MCSAMWSRSALWLWCACACALAARGAAYRERPRLRCPPAAGDRCQYDPYRDAFTLNGKEAEIYYDEEESFEASCAAAPLGDGAWPALERRAHFPTVSLRACAPPAGGYAAALRALNVSAGGGLRLLDLPASARLAPDAFAGLTALTRLGVNAENGTLELEAGVLDALEGLRVLALTSVRAARLPPRLDSLELTRTGLSALPPEALSVLELTLEEENLTSVSGAAPRLEKLWLHAPLPGALAAPALEYVSLSDAASERALGAQAGCGVRELRVARRAPRAPLPAAFLNCSARLQRFHASECHLDALPDDLFAYSPDLRLIDLSDNELVFLPWSLLSALPALEMLLLEGNRLSALALGALLAAPALGELHLSRNPLGDLCPAGGVSLLSPLTQLTALSLSSTGAVRVCEDWVRGARRLRALDLRDNDVRALACAELRVLRAPGVPADLDLTNNPVATINCSRDDYALEALNPTGDQSATLTLTLNARRKCSCNAFWLKSALRERGVAVAFVRADIYEPDDDCEYEWLRCATVGECGLPSSQQVELMVGGQQAARGELPWHAGVYRRDASAAPAPPRLRQICGGSIITTTVVVSAAHCFWGDVQKQLPETDFAVAVGKIYRRWDDPRDTDVQRFNVSKLELPERFLGSANNFQSDVALVTLAGVLEWRSHVRPICVDLGHDFETRQLYAGSLGLVSGWGLSSEDEYVYSDVLKVSSLPLVPVEECQRDAPAHFRQYITNDKICAGFRNGTAALCKGDSGGGLAFPAEERGRTRYYLRGVVSTSPRRDGHVCNARWLTAFTLLSRHARLVRPALGAAAQLQRPSPPR